MDHYLEIICVEPPHGLTKYQVSAQSDVNCKRSYTETKKFTDGGTDGRMDAEGYNIIRPFFKRAYKKKLNDTKKKKNNKTVLKIMIIIIK